MISWDLQISRSSGGSYLIYVPKATSRGGVYFKNQSILDLVKGNNFVSRGNMMQAEFYNLDGMLNILNQEFSLKVTLEPDAKSH